MTVNPKIQRALGMEVPEPEQPPSKLSLPVVVEPHEMPPLVDNPSLPDMTDIDRNLVEGEKQLEEMIQTGMGIVDRLYNEELPQSAPQFRRGVIEQIQMTYTAALNGIIHKTKLQLDKKKARLAEAGFARKEKAASGQGNVTNLFVGTREQVLEALMENGVIKDDS